MKYKNWYKLFDNFVKNYDLKDKWIMYEFHHVYRVIEYAKEIGKSLKLNDDDIDMVVLSSLLHDIARFSQYTNYKTFSDKDSFDHGDEGVRILKENDFIKKFITDQEKINIVLKAVKNHNKFKIEEMDKESQLIANIVRDADKIDIILEQGNTINDKSNELGDSLIKSISNHELCKKEDIHTDADKVCRMISFAFDFNYKYSYELLEKKKVLEKKFNLLETYINDDRINEMRKEVNKYIKERLEC